MSLFFVSYIINFIALGVLGVAFFRRYTNLSGVFFMIFCFGTGAWFIFYFLTYFGANTHQTLILLSQLSYATSIVALYSFLLFLYYFPKRKQRILNPILFIYIIFSALLYICYTYSPYIVEGLYYNKVKSDWYEVEGALFPYHLTLSFLFIPLSIILGIHSLGKSHYIERKRIQFILLGMLLFVILSFFFLLLLPIFGLWAMEKYIAFFFTPFILGVFYSVRRYDFLKFKIAFGHIFLFVYSLLCTFLVLKIFINYSRTLFSYEFKEYWGVGEGGLLVELTLGISIFMGIYFFLRQKLNPYFQEGGFAKVLEKMKIQIPFITDIDTLNHYLKKEFLNHFNIHHIKIVSNTSNYHKHILFYFETDMSRKFFMNDLVFLEENRNKFGSYDYKGIIESPEYLIFPLKNTDGSIRAILEIGKKRLKDPYFTSEISDLEGFALFLQGHLKYLSVYKKIQDLSINLDKQVDEKTIEYNNLLNKQKEFIAYVGHEIKNPITNSIFLCDSLKDELKHLREWDATTSKRLSEDGNILYEELMKVSGLVKSIFSAEQFDLNKVKLYRKSIDITQFLQSELRVFENSFSHIYFDIDLEEVGDKKIDETQFRQVIHNLLTNATKFAYSEKPRIAVLLKKKESGDIEIIIEDNGKGFKEIDIEQIFDKYATGDGSSVGLGMGLYLCKKIVELHKGTIVANNGDKLGGAKFTITF